MKCQICGFITNSERGSCEHCNKEPVLDFLGFSKSTLWEQAFRELRPVSEIISKKSEIKVSSLLARSSSALSIYFDLAFKELSSPDKKRELIKKIGEKRIDSIQSDDLHQAIGRYYEDSAKFLQSGSSDAGWLLDERRAVPSIYVRFLSYAVDFVVSLVFSLLLGCLLFFYQSPVASEIVLGVTPLQAGQLLSIGLRAVVFFCPIFLCVLPLLRLLLGRTAGEALMGLKLFSTDSSVLSLKKSIAWNLLSVLSLVSFGFFERGQPQQLWREKILNAKLLRT